MSLTIEIERRPAAVVFVRLEGRLDTTTYGELEKALAPVLAGRPQVILFDMAGLAFISSMGLRVIFHARKSVEQGGGRMMTTHLQPQIAKVFEIAAALPPENIFASIEEADRYLAAMQRKELEKQQPQRGKYSGSA